MSQLPQEMVDSLFLAPEGEPVDWTRLAYATAKRLATRRGWRCSRSDLEDVAVSGVTDGLLLFRQRTLLDGDVSSLAVQCVRRATSRAAYAYFCGSLRRDALRQTHRENCDAYELAEFGTAEQFAVPASDPKAAVQAVRDAAGRMLPASLRQVAVWTSLGYDQKDIATLESCSVRTVQGRLAECRKHVQGDGWHNIYATIVDAVREVLDDDKPLSGPRRPISKPMQKPVEVIRGKGISMTADVVHGNVTLFVG